MQMIKTIDVKQFLAEPETFLSAKKDDDKSLNEVNTVVSGIIAAVRSEGDKAVRRYTELYDRTCPEKFEVPPEAAKDAWEKLQTEEPRLAASLSFAADNLRRFSVLQKEQLKDFETELVPGLRTGQKIIPVERAAIYAPGGRFPLVSSALMALVPASVAGVGEKIIVSPPMEDGLPDRRILVAAHIGGADRIFALGGAQAIAAFALGTETVPKADLVAGPGNKYVVTAKRLLFGEVGIDFLPGPTDVLIITDQNASADITAADMLAQAEHDPDARARVLVPDTVTADQIKVSLKKRLALLPSRNIAEASLEEGGLFIVYNTKEEAVAAANKIAPEHLELHVSSPDDWVDNLKNYGSLFIGSAAAEVLGDYSAGINHVLPTNGTARFTGGLSVRHFLKFVTTLRCSSGKGYSDALGAAEIMARAEGLAGHAESALCRIKP